MKCDICGDIMELVFIPTIKETIKEPFDQILPTEETVYNVNCYLNWISVPTLIQFSSFQYAVINILCDGDHGLISAFKTYSRQQLDCAHQYQLMNAILDRRESNWNLWISLEDDLQDYDDLALIDYCLNSKKYIDCLFLLSRCFELISETKAIETTQALLKAIKIQALPTPNIWRKACPLKSSFASFFLAKYHPDRFEFIHRDITMNYVLKICSLDAMPLNLLRDPEITKATAHYRQAAIWAIEEEKLRSLKCIIMHLNTSEQNKVLRDKEIANAVMRCKNRNGVIEVLVWSRSHLPKGWFKMKMSIKILRERYFVRKSSSIKLENS